MENQNDINSQALDFDYQPTEENHSIIKVVGVGGGGSNAVQHMYETGIQDVSFLVINTDKQALKGSSIPHKLLISDKGLGAGAKPEIAHEFALQYTESIHQALNDGTEMVFITAGMGGGTGTGAAPVVAQIAQEMGILTVGIVTIPFSFEGRKKMMMALDGVREIEKWCDALLVVNNNRLIDVYPDLVFGNAFGKADDMLTNAAKSISEIITVQGYINLDFADVSTTLRKGGVALISTGFANGDNRLSKAIAAATNSPLLQDNKITDAKHLLFELCFSHEHQLSMSEIAEMNTFVESLNGEIEVIWGAMFDDSLGEDVKIILLASGFAMNHGTGDVISEGKLLDRAKKLQQELRTAITEYQSYLFEFNSYPEAQAILQEALRQATETANNINPLDLSVEEETALLQTALLNARAKVTEIEEEKRRKVEEEAAQAAAEAAEAKRQQELAIQAKIAELQAQLGNLSKADAKPQVTPAAATPEVAQVETKKEEPAEVKPAEVKPAEVKPAEVKPVEVKADPLQGIEEIRRFYGEEVASRMILDETRKAYYVLDNQELTNEQLIELLEKLPAYDRTQEDLGQLRAVSRQPAKPKVIGRHDVEGPDGTIKF